MAHTVGGLLVATFGNATELIKLKCALKNGRMRIVQQSLVGSIMPNMLMMLGCAFFSDGFVFFKKEQIFNKLRITHGEHGETSESSLPH